MSQFSSVVYLYGGTARGQLSMYCNPSPLSTQFQHSASQQLRIKKSLKTEWLKDITLRSIVVLETSSFKKFCRNLNFADFGAGVRDYNTLTAHRIIVDYTRF